MKKISDIAYGRNSTEERLDIYLPDGEVSSVFLYFHGGGLCGGDKSTAQAFAPYLAERGVCTMSANYRMYPNCRYPDFIFDAAEAVAWANKYMRNELKCHKLYVGGSSAGGYLTMMLCFDPKYLASFGVDNSVVAGYLHDAGQPTAHFNVLKERGVDSRRVIVDESAPMYFVGTAEKYPPMRFIVSDDDMKGRYEQTMLMLSVLSHFEYADYDHTVIHGKHCRYCEAKDENGISVFGRMIWDFIEKTEK